jgi:sec-independent protein translocase protein TatC
MANTPREQSFVEHLADLRVVLIRVCWILALGCGVCLYFGEQIFTYVRNPIVPYLPNHGLIFTAPIDKFISHLKVSFLAGVVLTCPLWLHQVWLFIAPGLYKKERKIALSFIFFGSGLFLAGFAFAYYLVLPMAFKYLLNFGGTVDQAMITIVDYISFFMTMTLVFGCAFEMPLILVTLGMLGLIDDKFLSRHRRMAIMVIAVFSAVITPPDAMSMMSLFIPLIVLYEISVILVKIVKPKQLDDGPQA